MISIRARNILISIFVILWSLLFHYESMRTFFLSSLLQKPLPKLKFLFPPAGWIMFYNVDNSFGHAEVYGVKGNDVQVIDPHLILMNRTIGYDNVHRNVLSTVLYDDRKRSFCRYMRRKFPEFDKFLVAYVHYPSLDENPRNRIVKVMYQCLE